MPSRPRIWVQVAQQSPELALIVDDESRCWFASLTLHRVTGFTEAEVIGQPLRRAGAPRRTVTGSSRPSSPSASTPASTR